MVFWIDNHLFPLLKRYMAWRWHITGILLVMMLLMYPGNPVIIVLMVNSYLNCMSVATSAMVLGEQERKHEDVLDHHEQVLTYHADHGNDLDQILARLESIENRLSPIVKEQNDRL